MSSNLLEVKNIEVNIEKKYGLYSQDQKKTILNNFDLTIKKGEIHVLMGPNGCGKSTFSKVLVGHPSYKVEKGNIFFLDQEITYLSPELRSHEGIFLAFQYPPEISGVTTYDFLRLAFNQKQKYFGLKELDPIEFMIKIQEIVNKIKIKEEFLNRNLNEGFSGGEKKRNEILQMILLQPKLVILDEIDSGLDIDALKLICQTLKENLSSESSLLVITHNPKMLDYLQPHYIHVMLNGKIWKTGQRELVDILEKEGYDILTKVQN
jgi:Fe-S cluster assembly ATP-binding protein